MKKIKVAIVGVGNCASSLVQTIEAYKRNKNLLKNNIGILHSLIGEYSVGDIEFVAAFDINDKKVGKDLSEGIFSFPNCALKIFDVHHLGVEIDKGPILDGLPAVLKEKISVNSKTSIADVKKVLIERDAELLINFLPTGSTKASRFYVQQALEANCGFINAIPELIASDPEWNRKFSDNGLPLIGDDVKSQIGGTIIHRALIDLFVERGVKIEGTSQLNFGGNTDYLNLSDENRFKTKLVTKEKAIKSLIPYETKIDIPLPTYTENLGDSRICKISILGKYFGNTSISVDVNINLEDSPNAAGVIVDIIRFMKVALNRGDSGVLSDICPFYFKHPPNPCNDYFAYQKVKNYLQK